jgi:peptide/nickel transport system permease protein
MEHESEVVSDQPRTYLGDVWRELRRNPVAVAGAMVLLVIGLATAVGPLLSTSSSELNFRQTLQPPSLAHPMGTNMLGQDVLQLVLNGGRISLLVGITAMVVAISIGTTVGALAGFFGGRSPDMVLMRITDLFLSMPGLPLLLLIVYLFQAPLRSVFGAFVGAFILVVTVIGVVSWMSVARLVRAAVLSVREKEYVQAAEAIGASPGRIILVHVLPNATSPVIVAATLSVGTAIITESTLSYLGYGFPPDTPTWGRLLKEGQQYLQFAPHIVLFPGLFIVLTVLSINALGDGLRDALDPHLRGR